MTSPSNPASLSPAAHLRGRLDLVPGQAVRRITLQNAAGETSVTEVSRDGLRAVRGFPSGVRQWEWVEGQALLVGSEEGDAGWRHLFDDAGRLIRKERAGAQGWRVTAEYHYDGPRLSSASVYEQVGDGQMGWVESTFVPHPPEQGGVRREQVTEHYPDGLMSVELREFDAGGREIYNELYSNNDDVFHVSRTSYRDDEHGNWVEMCIRSHSNRPGSERAYVHRRNIEYWE